MVCVDSLKKLSLSTFECRSAQQPFWGLTGWMTQSVSLRVIHTELCQQGVFGWPSGFSGNDWFVSTIIMLVIVALSDISLLSNGSA